MQTARIAKSKLRITATTKTARLRRRMRLSSSMRTPWPGVQLTSELVMAVAKKTPMKRAIQ